jgi:hypothetical protein
LPWLGQIRQGLNPHRREIAPALKLEIKEFLIEDLMPTLTAEEIGDGQPLFGPAGAGRIRGDASPLIIALGKKSGLKIQNPETAKHILQTANTMAGAIIRHRAVSGAMSGAGLRTNPMPICGAERTCKNPAPSTILHLLLIHNRLTTGGIYEKDFIVRRTDEWVCRLWRGCIPG